MHQPDDILFRFRRINPTLLICSWYEKCHWTWIFFLGFPETTITAEHLFFSSHERSQHRTQIIFTPQRNSSASLGGSVGNTLAEEKRTVRKAWAGKGNGTAERTGRDKCVADRGWNPTRKADFLSSPVLAALFCCQGAMIELAFGKLAYWS